MTAPTTTNWSGSATPAGAGTPCCRVFQRIEDNALGASPARGAGGPLHVSTAPQAEPLCEEAIAAGTGLGWRRTDDLNASDDERIGYAMATIKNGQRFSAARAFLHPVADRPNLTVSVDTVVTRVLAEHGRAVGVHTRSKGLETDVRARREVILSAGSIATPKILQLSGIGPAETLKSAGVDVLVDSPHVGGRMREHRCFVVQYRLKDDLGYNKALSTPLRQALSGRDTWRPAVDRWPRPPSTSSPSSRPAPNSPGPTRSCSSRRCPCCPTSPARRPAWNASPE